MEKDPKKLQSEAERLSDERIQKLMGESIEGKLSTLKELQKKETEYRRGRQYGIKTVGAISITQELDRTTRRVLDTSDLYRVSRETRTVTERRNVVEIRRLYSEYRPSPERRASPEERRITPERRTVNEYRNTLERRTTPPKRRVALEEFRRIVDRYERPIERIRTPPYRPTPERGRTPPYRTPPYTPPRTPPRTPPPIRTIKRFKDAIDHASKGRKGRYKWDINNPVPTFESLFGG